MPKELKEELKEMTEEWKSLERKTLEQRKIASEFYDKNLMRLIESTYIKNNQDKVYEKVQYLVVSVGTSYEPIVLNISLLKPEHILFLITDKSEAVLEKIVNYNHLTPAQYDKRRVNEIEPTDIYREIKRAYLEWNHPDRMYVDFTGGTKAMSAACALAGAMIDIQMIYVSTSEYLTDFRKPNPGSERLAYIDNPISVFGDLEIEKAIELFDKGNFAGAVSRLTTLKEKIPDPGIRQQLEFVYHLSKAYESWDALDFIPAHESMNTLRTELIRDRKAHREFILMDRLEKIDQQAKMLEDLAGIPPLLKEKKNVEILKSDTIMNSLMFTMFENANIRESQEKYDMATLLFYRLLEMMEQKRLMKYNLYVSNPDYTAIRYDFTIYPEMEPLNKQERVQLLKDNVHYIRKSLFTRNFDDYLPDKIALLDGFTLLAAMQDPFMNFQKLNGVPLLKKIRSMVYLRNNSIFAHGLGPVNKDDYTKFRNFVSDYFRYFCQIAEIDFDKTMDGMSWIKLNQIGSALTGWKN